MPRGLPDSFTLTAIRRLSRRLRRAGKSPVGGRRPIYYRLVNLTLYKPILNFELRHMYGMVGQHMRKLGHKVAWRARAQVGVQTGALKSSIKMKVHQRVGGVRITVGGYTPYALMHHQGTRPHWIIARKAPNLVFMRKGRLIRTPIVIHPGTRPNRYLTDQLRPGVFRQVKGPRL